MIVCLVAAKTKQNFSMFNYVPVSRVAVFLLALAIYGIQVKGVVALESSEREKETSSLEETAPEAANDSWVESLAWNLLGYATIIVPAAVIIRMLKNSNFNEQSGTGCLFWSIQLCVFGTPRDSPDIEQGTKERKRDSAEYIPTQWGLGSSGEAEEPEVSTGGIYDHLAETELNTDSEDDEDEEEEEKEREGEQEKEEHGAFPQEPCIICLTQPRNALASIVHGQTGLQVCCIGCATRLKEEKKKCPLCRKKIKLVVKNYF